jgi:hypothetical protein
MNRRQNDRQKSYATGYTCNSRLQKGITIFFAKKLDKVLVQIMLVVLSGFKIMGKIEMAGAMFPPSFVLKLPVAKGKVPKQKCPWEWRVGLKIFGWVL